MASQSKVREYLSNIYSYACPFLIRFAKIKQFSWESYSIVTNSTRTKSAIIIERTIVQHILFELVAASPYR